ncbi:MAG: phosphatase PAP2 family protein [Acidobacteriota bacterium]
MRTQGLLSALAVLLLTSACATVPAVRTAAPAVLDPSPATESLAFASRVLESPPVTGEPGLAAQPRGLVRLLANDVAQMATAPLRWGSSDWMKLGIGVLAVGGVALLDEDLRKSVDSGSTGTSRSLASVVEPFGAEYSAGVLGGFFLAGKLFDDDKASAVAEDGLVSSLIASGAITPLLKVAMGRRRPSQTQATLELGGGGESFPSGHTTQAFAVASVVATHYDSIWVKVGAYGLASLVGWSRMQDKAHYASDVLAGALIGIVVGKAVVRLHESQRIRISASPSVNRGSAGVALTFGTSLDDALRFLKSD